MARWARARDEYGRLVAAIGGGGQDPGGCAHAIICASIFAMYASLESMRALPSAMRFVGIGIAKDCKIRCSRCAATVKEGRFPRACGATRLRSRLPLGESSAQSLGSF